MCCRCWSVAPAPSSTRRRLARQALGRALSAYDRSIDVHVSKIRKKLAALGGDNLIVSVRGSGYQFRIRPG